MILIHSFQCCLLLGEHIILCFEGVTHLLCVMSTVPACKTCYRAALQALSLLGQEIPWVQHFSVITYSGDLAQKQQEGLEELGRMSKSLQSEGTGRCLQKFPQDCSKLFLI